MENVELSGAEDKDAQQIYEIGYLVVPNISDDELNAETAAIKTRVQDAGGTVLSEESPKPRKLFYTMYKTVGGQRLKFDSASFGWIKFEAGAAVPEPLAKWLTSRERIIRFIFIKTVRENTLASTKLAHISRSEGLRPLSRTEATRPVSKEEKSVPISETELDSAIEKLVVG